MPTPTSVREPRIDVNSSADRSAAFSRIDKRAMLDMAEALLHEPPPSVTEDGPTGPAETPSSDVPTHGDAALREDDPLHGDEPPQDT